MEKWKVFDAVSWRAMLASLARIKETADGNSSAVSGLGEDLAELSQATVRTLRELNESLGETQAAIEKLRRDIESGAVSVKPVFPMVSADVADPEVGEAWILAEQNKEE